MNASRILPAPRSWAHAGVRANKVDAALQRRITRWQLPRWVALWMRYSSRSGDGWLWIVAALAVLLFGGRMRYDAVACAALSALLGVACFVIVKSRVRRPRPAATHPGASHRPWQCSRYRDEFSFPSGHTLTAFAVAIPFLIYYPDFGACLVACALCIAASRLVLGLHFLSDVLAGGVLGAGLGCLSALLLR